MLATLTRTRPGSAFVDFMRTERGRKIDKVIFQIFDVSLLMQIYAARGGFPPMPMLSLHTIGRKSGQVRWTVMPYVPVGQILYLIGSNGARADDPAWVKNLRSNPKAQIRVKRRKRDVTARVVSFDSAEYKEAWAAAQKLTPQYQNYSGMTTRQIPVVALE